MKRSAQRGGSLEESMVRKASKEKTHYRPGTCSHCLLIPASMNATSRSHVAPSIAFTPVRASRPCDYLGSRERIRYRGIGRLFDFHQAALGDRTLSE